MVVPKGYPLDQHMVYSHGYELCTFRIPYGQVRNFTGQQRLSNNVHWLSALVNAELVWLTCRIHLSQSLVLGSSANRVGWEHDTLGQTCCLACLHYRRSCSNQSHLCFVHLVLLIHGISLASTCWVINTPQQSLAFLLADQGKLLLCSCAATVSVKVCEFYSCLSPGYDVWMMNTRGNTFSDSNDFYSTAQPQFWSFAMVSAASASNGLYMSPD